MLYISLDIDIDNKEENSFDWVKLSVLSGKVLVILMWISII